MNTLYYGDNLDILRRYIKDESVDLIYLHPSFDSNRSYDVPFKDEVGCRGRFADNRVRRHVALDGCGKGLSQIDKDL